MNSRIIRYADIVVHRLLQRGLNLEATNRGGAVYEITSPPNSESMNDPLEVISAYNYIDAEGRIINRSNSLVAAHCNEKRLASKAAQERSDEVYLAVYIMRREEKTQVSATVVGIGNKSFSVFIPAFSINARLFVEEMDDIASNFIESTRTLVLRRCKDKSKENDKAKRRTYGKSSDQSDGTIASRTNERYSEESVEGRNYFNFLEIRLLDEIVIEIVVRKKPPVSLQYIVVGAKTQV
jgi:DIS3-like exonuclease 2